MKIAKRRCKMRGRELRSVSSGTPVVFCKQFHQEHCIADVFMVVDDNGYLSEGHNRIYNKTPVVNMKTGKMSVVCHKRECMMVEGEFVPEEECVLCRTSN